MRRLRTLAARDARREHTKGGNQRRRGTNACRPHFQPRAGCICCTIPTIRHDDPDRMRKRFRERIRSAFSIAFPISVAMLRCRKTLPPVRHARLRLRRDRGGAGPVRRVVEARQGRVLGTGREFRSAQGGEPARPRADAGPSRRQCADRECRDPHAPRRRVPEERAAARGRGCARAGPARPRVHRRALLCGDRHHRLSRALVHALRRHDGRAHPCGHAREAAPQLGDLRGHVSRHVRILAAKTSVRSTCWPRSCRDGRARARTSRRRVPRSTRRCKESRSTRSSRRYSRGTGPEPCSNDAHPKENERWP